MKQLLFQAFKKQSESFVIRIKSSYKIQIKQ